MSEETLERLVSDYLALGFSNNSFAWQGGEPTLMGLDFYKTLIELQKKHSNGPRLITNALQTNGVLLDDQWCQFLAEYNWLVGISLDGPQKYHNHYRSDKGGDGSYERVLNAINCCKSHRVQFNILVLLNDLNSKAPDELFDYFTGLNIKYLQFVPCVETDSDGKITDFSVKPKDYGDFMCRIFDRWLDYGPQKLSIRLFDSLMNFVLTGMHTNCTFGRSCRDYIVVEHNGDAFCCDFFVGEDYRLGNIAETNIGDISHGEKKRSFASKKSQISNKCMLCRYLPACRGGCLKDRLAVSGDSFKYPSYFCSAYKQFFDHAMPKLTQLVAELSANGSIARN